MKINLSDDIKKKAIASGVLVVCAVFVCLFNFQSLKLVKEHNLLINGSITRIEEGLNNCIVGSTVVSSALEVIRNTETDFSVRLFGTGVGVSWNMGAFLDGAISSLNKFAIVYCCGRFFFLFFSFFFLSDCHIVLT